jgi:ATP-dependent RNA helicase RhlE
MTFEQLGLDASLLRALQTINYTSPTPIQAQAIPVVLQGKDLFGCARTGTGKTAAFALPVLQQMQLANAGPQRKLRTLILAPTRELAAQINDNIREYSAHLPLKHQVIFGGVSQVPQVERLRKGLDLLVATPGRLLDLIGQGLLSLKDIEFFVLDEADRMLDMGFIHDIKRVLTFLPARRQNLFFSATVTPDIRKLADTILKQPVTVSADPVSSASHLVDQSVYFVAKENKRALLRHVLQENQLEHVLVFTRTKRGADRVARDLNKSGISADAIHGDKSQGAREKAMSRFKNKNIRVLVATDIAARGIDVEKLSHVINFELPEVAETYVHRIGRTGRAGSSGIALSFCSDDERDYFRDITRLVKSSIDVVKAHPYQ